MLIALSLVRAVYHIYRVCLELVLKFSSFVLCYFPYIYYMTYIYKHVMRYIILCPSRVDHLLINIYFSNVDHTRLDVIIICIIHCVCRDFNTYIIILNVHTIRVWCLYYTTVCACSLCHHRDQDTRDEKKKQF